MLEANKTIKTKYIYTESIVGDIYIIYIVYTYYGDDYPIESTNREVKTNECMAYQKMYRRNMTKNQYDTML